MFNRVFDKARGRMGAAQQPSARPVLKKAFGMRPVGLSALKRVRKPNAELPSVATGNGAVSVPPARVFNPQGGAATPKSPSNRSFGGLRGLLGRRRVQ